MISRAAITALALALLACGAAQGAEPPTAQSLLDAAIEAHGGRDALAALPSLELKGSVETLTGRGAGRRADVILRERPDGAYRREATFEFRGRRMTSVEFYDGHVVKRRFGSAWDDLPADEAREAAAHRLPWLLAIDPATATVEGEATEADVACWRVSVADGADGAASATLWLARDDGRLVAVDRAGTSAEGMGTKKQVRVKTIYRDVRAVGALRLPFDVETAEDGVPDARLRWETVQALREFDPEWIRLPDPTRRFIPPEELAN